MVLTLVLLFGLVSTPVATPVDMSPSPQWTVPTGAAMGPEAARLLIVGDMVVVANTDRTVLALDTRTGNIEWATFITENVSAPMAVHGNSLLVPGGKGTLYALDLETGSTVDAVGMSADRLLEPLVMDDAVVVSDERGTVHIIDAESFEVQATVVVSGRITHADIAGGMAIFASEEGVMSAIEPDTASLAWQVVLPGTPAEVQAAGDGIAVGTDSGDLLMLESADGRVRWHQAFVASSFTDIAFTGTEVLGITKAGDLLMVDMLTGAPAWQDVLPTGGWFARDQCDPGCPIVTHDGAIFLLAPASRERLVPVTAVQDVVASPAATADVLVVVTQQGDVHGWVLNPD